MNRLERRVRNVINPYSTAFATWWCHTARYWRLPRTITEGKTAGRPGLPQLAVYRPAVARSVVRRSSLPVFAAGANVSGEQPPSLGSADPIACDPTGRERLRLGGQDRDAGPPGRMARRSTPSPAK